MSNLHQRIMDGFVHTQYWSDIPEAYKKQISKTISDARNLMPPQGVRWVSRIIRRAAIILSIDANKDTLIDLPLTPTARGVTATFGTDAGPRDLWLEINSSYFVDVGEPTADGVYALTTADDILKPGSKVDFNTKKITLIPAAGTKVTVLRTVSQAGGALNKWRRRSNQIKKVYTENRCLDDLNFFVHSTNRGQIMTVLKTLREAAVRNKILARAIEHMSYTDQNGVDLPATGSGAQGGCVYDTLNELMKHISDLDKLPKGDTIMKFPDGTLWTMLDAHGDKIEGGMMSHCFSGGTEVATLGGPRQLRSLVDGEVMLLTVDFAGATATASWKGVAVKSFGVQPLHQVTLNWGAETLVVHATAGHRWLTQTGDKTTEQLGPGDVLISLSEDLFINHDWSVTGVTPTDRVEEVFCAEVPGTHNFALANKIVVGNCGNSGGLAGDRLLSYRVPSKKIEGLHEPKLTFIYRPKDKSVGEMKGYANSKPNEAYHDAIVALLSDTSKFSKLRGEGYLPQNSFNLNDLSDKKLATLYAANPELVRAALDASDQSQRLANHTVKALEKLVGPLNPEVPAVKKPRATKPKPADET